MRHSGEHGSPYLPLDFKPHIAAHMGWHVGDTILESRYHSRGGVPNYPVPDVVNDGCYPHV